MQVPPLKCWYVSTRLHDVIFHNTMRLILFPLKNMFPLICRLILRQSIYWCFSCTRMFPRDGLNWVSSIMCSLFCVCVWRNSPTTANSTSFLRGGGVLDHTQLDTQRHKHIQYDSPERVINPPQRPLPSQHTANTAAEHPRPQRNSNPRSGDRATASLRLRPHDQGYWLP